MICYHRDMHKARKLILLTMIGALAATGALAESVSCPNCDAPREQTSRERIKADREQYNRDNLKVTTRPWDGLKLGRAQPEDKKTPTIQ